MFSGVRARCSVLHANSTPGRVRAVSHGCSRILNNFAFALARPGGCVCSPWSVTLRYLPRGCARSDAAHLPRAARRERQARRAARPKDKGARAQVGWGKPRRTATSGTRAQSGGSGTPPSQTAGLSACSLRTRPGGPSGRLNIVVQSSFVPKRTSTLLASHGSAKRDMRKQLEYLSYVIWQSKKKRILFPVAF